MADNYNFLDSLGGYFNTAGNIMLANPEITGGLLGAGVGYMADGKQGAAYGLGLGGLGGLGMRQGLLGQGMSDSVSKASDYSVSNMFGAAGGSNAKQKGLFDGTFLDYAKAGGDIWSKYNEQKNAEEQIAMQKRINEFNIAQAEAAEKRRAATEQNIDTAFNKSAFKNYYS